MRRYVFSLFFVVAVSFMLLVSLGYARDQQGNGGSGAGAEAVSEASIVTPNDSVADFDNVDIWRIKCVNNQGAIRANVFSFGTFGDNKVYVNVTCNASGKGDMEFADPGEPADGPNPSNFAGTGSNCLQATALYHCDDDSFCDESWNSIIECVGRGFAAGFPNKSKSSP